MTLLSGPDNVIMSKKIFFMHPINHNTHHHHFFENKEIDALYFTSALTNFGQSLVSIFIPIYFWTLGFPLWQIMLFYLLRSGYFLVFSFGLLPLIRHMSNKMMMFLSVPFILLYYFGLEQVTSCNAIFYIIPGLVALNMLFLMSVIIWSLLMRLMAIKWGANWGFVVLLIC